MSDELNTHCAACGMPSAPKEYHPYAACLMFQACHNSETVKANLEAVVKHGESRADSKPYKHLTFEEWCEDSGFAPLDCIPKLIFNAARERKK